MHLNRLEQYRSSNERMPLPSIITVTTFPIFIIDTAMPKLERDWVLQQSILYMKNTASP